MTSVDYWATTYISLVLDLPPLVAQAAYDAQTCASGPGHRWCMVTASGRLTACTPVHISDGTRGSAYRAQRSVIVAGIWRWPAELELRPWSTRRTQLGLRPADVALFRCPPEPVFAAGHDGLARIATLLEDWTEQPLRELTAGFVRRNDS